MQVVGLSYNHRLLHRIKIKIKMGGGKWKLKKNSDSSLLLHWSSSKFLVVMAACTPSIHVFLGRRPFLLSRRNQCIINFGILSSGNLLTWPYHCSLFCSMISMMSGFPFTPIISFVWSFFILSILDFLAALLHTNS